MDTCPNCHRKLLSHASSRCNWCGAEINDESYQQQAAQERANFRAHEATRDAIESARSLSMNYAPVPGWGGPIAAARILGNSWQRRKQVEAQVKAQARAMQEYAATQQGGVNPQQGGLNPTQQPPQGNQVWQDVASPRNQQAANQADQEAPAAPENEVGSMFRHLEL